MSAREQFLQKALFRYLVTLTMCIVSREEGIYLEYEYFKDVLHFPLFPKHFFSSIWQEEF